MVEKKRSRRQNIYRRALIRLHVAVRLGALYTVNFVSRGALKIGAKGLQELPGVMGFDDGIEDQQRQEQLFPCRR